MDNIVYVFNSFVIRAYSLEVGYKGERGARSELRVGALERLGLRGFAHGEADREALTKGFESDFTADETCAAGDEDEFGGGHVRGRGVRKASWFLRAW